MAHVRQFARTDFVHSQGRSSLMLVLLSGANRVKDLMRIMFKARRDYLLGPKSPPCSLYERLI